MTILIRLKKQPTREVNMELHDTVMGRRFFEGTMPKMADAVAELSEAVKKLTESLAEKKPEKAAEAVEGEVVFMYNDTRCHAKITDELWIGAKYRYIGQLDGYRIFQSAECAIFDQRGFVAVK